MKKSKKLLCILLCITVISTALAPATSAAVTDAATPVSADEAELKWSVKLGTSYVNAPSVPTVYGDYVFTMCKNTLYKLNAENGQTVQTAEMSSTPSFGYTPVCADNGTVFCPLEGGTVEAFDAETMQRKWTYTDPLGGQALSPVTLNAGMVYTGFWNDEEDDANYICLDAADGSLIRSFTRKGGFYWAVPAFTDECILIGGDNGSSETDSPAFLYSLNKNTGEIIDAETIIGDQRSGIAEYNGHYYYVTKAGYLYKTAVDGNGYFTETESVKLSGASTSTPVIYNGNVYIGVQSNGFSGIIAVLDAENLATKSTVSMKGYPQNEVLITTAYEDVYIYSTYNSPPGGLTVIDSSMKTSELYSPEDDSKGYCISTVTATDNETLIYKNDSGTIFAVGKKTAEEPQKSFFERIIDWIRLIFSKIAGLIARGET